jgi:hypothetical protein
MALHALLDHECCIFAEKNAAFESRKASGQPRSQMGAAGIKKRRIPGDPFE